MSFSCVQHTAQYKSAAGILPSNHAMITDTFPYRQSLLFMKLFISVQLMLLMAFFIACFEHILALCLIAPYRGHIAY